jgi:cation:H+ antiporter
LVPDSPLATWTAFLVAASVIVLAGTWLARYGDVIAEKTGLGRNWVGLILVAATTSLPELFTGIGATAYYALPDIAVGDVLGSCMFNLLILSLMDAVAGEDSLTARAHQGHALAIGFGLCAAGIAGLGLAVGPRMPSMLAIGLPSFALIALYFVAARLIFEYERRRMAREVSKVAEELHYERITLRSAVSRYAVAAVAVVSAALFLPGLAERIATDTGLGQAFVGNLFVALTTSLPEVVVSVAAVRLGALDLGIANVLGSNLFNLLILAIDDVLYRPAPILAASDPIQMIVILAVVVMYAVLLVGLTYQVLKKRLVVAWDTGCILAAYVVAVGLLFFLRP